MQLVVERVVPTRLFGAALPQPDGDNAFDLQAHSRSTWIVATQVARLPRIFSGAFVETHFSDSNCMTSRRWPLSRSWILIPVLACVFILWTNASRIQRIERVSDVGAEALKLDPSSQTGYEHGVRKLIVPERNAASYQWIGQTQQMLARGEWRIRQVEYDNAPEGRENHNASLYHWWLGFLAKSIQLMRGIPMGAAVEGAALWAGPILHVLLLTMFTVFGVRCFGPRIGVLLALGLTGLFPLGGAFLAGQPDDFALSCAVALGSVLALVAAFHVREATGVTAEAGTISPALPRNRRFIVLAGVLGGVGLWINARVQVPVLIGVVIGAIASAWLANRTAPLANTASFSSMWRTWGVVGALTSFGAYLLEYFPSHLDVSALRLEVNHPLYALAWLGAGELIHAWHRFSATGKFFHSRSDIALMLGGLLSVAAVPLVISMHSTHGFLATNPADLKLAQTSDAPLATSLLKWFQRDGFTAAFAVTCLPLLTLIPAGWLLMRHRSTRRLYTTPFLLALAPVITLVIFACFRLRFWGVVDAMLLVLMAAALSAAVDGIARSTRRCLSIAALICFAPGLWMMRATVPISAKDAVTELEAQSLVERDVAHWLSQRGGDDRAIVLAPPNLTSALIYFGAVRGLATPYWENFDGFAAAVRVAGATSMAEADSLMRRREVKFIVVPSWDADLTSYAALGTTDTDATLIGRIERWLPPLSLRPIAYKLPLISGFEGRSIAVFAATDMQDDPLALSRLAEYFLEMAQLDFALRVIGTIQLKYLEDPNGMIARAQVAAGTNDVAGFGEALAALLPTIERGDDDGLPWDRRISLAVVLAQGKRPELTRTQLERCLDEIDQSLLRSLSNASLYRLLVLMQRLNLEMPDPALRDLAQRLLPAEMRERLN